MSLVCGEVVKEQQRVIMVEGYQSVNTCLNSNLQTGITVIECRRFIIRSPHEHRQPGIW